MDTALILVKNAERMMTAARLTEVGVELIFADGRRGVIPFADIPDVRDASHMAGIELPNPHQVVLTNVDGESVEISWDFARRYCDASYRAPKGAGAVQDGLSAADYPILATIWDNDDDEVFNSL